jgi:hypothetical protein
MMRDHFKQVKSDDPLRMPAATFNTFIDAAGHYLERQAREVDVTVKPSQRASPWRTCRC